MRRWHLARSVTAVVLALVTVGCDSDGGGPSLEGRPVPPPAEQAAIDVCGLVPRAALEESLRGFEISDSALTGPETCGMVIGGAGAWVAIGRTSRLGLEKYEKRRVGQSDVYVPECFAMDSLFQYPVVVGPQGVVVDVSGSKVPSLDPLPADVFCRIQVALAESVAERLPSPPRRTWPRGSLAGVDLCAALRGVKIVDTAEGPHASPTSRACSWSWDVAPRDRDSFTVEVTYTNVTSRSQFERPLGPQQTIDGHRAWVANRDDGCEIYVEHGPAVPDAPPGASEMLHFWLDSDGSCDDAVHMVRQVIPAVDAVAPFRR